MNQEHLISNNLWVIQVLEEMRRVSKCWRLSALESGLKQLTSLSIRTMICDRPQNLNAAAMKVLIFVSNPPSEINFTPSAHFRSPKDEVIFSLKELAELCREIGEPLLALEIQKFVDCHSQPENASFQKSECTAKRRLKVYDFSSSQL